MDVAEIEPDGRDNSLRQRLADSDRLWVASLIAIVIVAGTLYLGLRNQTVDQAKFTITPVTRQAPYNYKQRRQFAAKFKEENSRGEQIIDARFVGPKRFRITVPASISADAIEYLSSMAANRILHDFRTRAVVELYMRRAADSQSVLAATTRWRDDKYGFVVKFASGTTRPL